MSEVNVHYAKTHLSKLIQDALRGEEVVIARRNKPVVRLQAISPAPIERRFGGLKRLVVQMGDSFDDEVEDFADYAPSRK